MLSFREFDEVMSVIETAQNEELDEIIRMVRNREEMLRIEGDRANLLSNMADFRNSPERSLD